jgi:hypothetical protein
VHGDDEIDVIEKRLQGGRMRRVDLARRDVPLEVRRLTHRVQRRIVSGLPTNLTGFSAAVGVVGMLAVVVILWLCPSSSERLPASV